MTEDELVEYLSELTEEHWKNHETPLLLSKIPSIIRENRQANYKDAIGVKTLKEFARQREGNQSFKVVQDRNAKAKVGLIPASREYIFPVLDRLSPVAMPKAHHLVSSRDATISFLEAISTLPDDHLNGIVIPTRTLAILLKKT